MTVLVAYASKHGATRGIAERIALDLNESGVPADVRPVEAVGDLDQYDGFVIGSATYAFHWLKPAQRFVHHHEQVLGRRPVWLFSSGPLGDEAEQNGRDVREDAQPKEVRRLAELLRARDAHVFFGALDPGRLTVAERLVRTMPAGRKLLPEGDFRDWDDIDDWTAGIAQELRSSDAL